ncbi:MAG: hypothetical protein RBG13Loki_4006 [Promethearchaeota archaeon CR_4]|nr:MAG: hypothetical protein RBG13Loki_4006 [Candidatus Lokiarchaeota archaeon CR_4]
MQITAISTFSGTSVMVGNALKSKMVDSLGFIGYNFPILGNPD